MKGSIIKMGKHLSYLEDHLNKRSRIPKRHSKMNNQEKLAIRRKKQKQNKNTTQYRETVNIG